MLISKINYHVLLTQFITKETSLCAIFCRRLGCFPMAKGCTSSFDRTWLFRSLLVRFLAGLSMLPYSTLKQPVCTCKISQAFLAHTNKIRQAFLAAFHTIFIIYHFKRDKKDCLKLIEQNLILTFIFRHFGHIFISFW